MRKISWFGNASASSIAAATPVLLAAALFAVGCNDSNSPRDVNPPAAPRGFHSTTGDGEVFLDWLANTERDVAGYRVYEGPCASGGDCPYELIGTTGVTHFRVGGLTNGVTRYFGVSAFDRSGNESVLADIDVDVFDTPRPEGFGRVLQNQATGPSASGWDFSAYAVRAFDHEDTDIYYATRDGVPVMFAPFTDTDIQDAGYTTTLDDVDFAPTSGWSANGIVELIVGHSYVVWTHDDHYAKFRVTSVSSGQVTFDWAYQVDTGNPELKQRPTVSGPRTRRPWPSV